jgi:hypothetical protein
METRLDLTLGPDLSLQLFVQPLISAGDFVAYKQLARAQSFEFEGFEEGTAVSADGTVRCRDGTTCATDDVRWFDLDGDGATDFSVETSDFVIRSLRGNAVLRWEYRPGSTLFLVWQQNRESDAGVGRFDFGRDVGALFDAPADHTFIVKVSHFLDV